MHVIQARSVTDALAQGVNYVTQHGVERESRNGPVLVAPTPVTTFTEKPHWRVLFMSGRGDNPFFHFIEALWMLDGQDKIAPLVPIVKNIANYSDNGRTLHGAYGYRWRRWFSRDQLDWAVLRLTANKDDRRVVITMWDPNEDIEKADTNGKDVPCNTHIYLGVSELGLDLTVCCRSNDLVWGAHGANAVHFSMLQEYLAARIGVPLGRMWQVSNNYHAYKSALTPELIASCGEGAWNNCRYVKGEVQPYPMFDDNRVEQWDEDLKMWWRDPYKVGLRHEFFRRVATPIWAAHEAYRKKDFAAAQETIEQCYASDWKAACKAWLLIAEARHARAQDDGAQS